VILGVFGQVAVFARFSNRFDDRGTISGFELLEFGLKVSVTRTGHWDLFHWRIVRMKRGHVDEIRARGRLDSELSWYLTQCGG